VGWLPGRGLLRGKPGPAEAGTPAPQEGVLYAPFVCHTKAVVNTTA
jgi:hypothetical protein